MLTHAAAEHPWLERHEHQAKQDAADNGASVNGVSIIPVK